MKARAFVLASLTLLIACDLHAQGSGIVTFSNVGATPDRRILVYEGGVGGYAGAGYAIALYWGPAGTTDDRNMVQIGGSAGFLSTAGVGTGIFFGGGRTINTGQPVNGPVLAFQARGWCTAGGTITTYEQALASGMVATGKGPVFDLKTKDPTDATELTPNIGQAAGWRGFAIMSLDGGHICIPEPSTIGLGVLGAGLLMLLHRRRQ